MPGEHCPVQWVGLAAVVSLPGEIDLTNADQIREDLLAIFSRGATTVVVDMNGTTFCDSAGVNALVRAYQQATAQSVVMRLAVSVPAVQRVLTITGVDSLIELYPSVGAALADVRQPSSDEAPEVPPAIIRTDPDGLAPQPG